MEGITSFTPRLTKILWDGAKQKVDGLDNKGYVGGVEQTNFYIAKETEVTLMLLHERAGYLSTFGYYYYKGSGEKDVTDLPKYVIFPNVSIGGDDPSDNPPNNKKVEEAPLKAGDKVKLKFFGEDGKGAMEDRFPVGYTIGWFIIPDGYLGGNNTFTNANKNEIQNFEQIRTSNDADVDRKFISVYDERYRGVVVGCEDGPDQSYEDMLFCVFTTDMDAIVDPKNPGRPFIDKDDTDEIALPDDVTEQTVGTLAFEDIWPSGGDYDMNDVVVEYTRAITFNYKNEVQKITDTFAPVHDGAGLINGFAYQIDASQMGTVTDMPGESEREAATNSIIVFANARKATREKTSFTIVRDLSGSVIAKKDIKPYNPFIFHSEDGKENRVEVHLPKQAPTSKADKSLNLTHDDAYYVNVKGKYAFAINIPIHGFIPPTEYNHIDAETEYPDFRKWADSNGATNTDWYLNYAGNKE
jgi:LruC domain-containing protein